MIDLDFLCSYFVLCFFGKKMYQTCILVVGNHEMIYELFYDCYLVGCEFV